MGQVPYPRSAINMDCVLKSVYLSKDDLLNLHIMLRDETQMLPESQYCFTLNLHKSPISLNKKGDQWLSSVLEQVCISFKLEGILSLFILDCPSGENFV